MLSKARVNLTKELSSIAASASSLKERLNKIFIPNTVNNKDPEIDTRLEQWCQVAAQGNSAKFEKRLAWDKLDLKTIGSFLGSVKHDDRQPLPSWTNTLAEIIETAESCKDLSQPYLDPEDPVPFELVYIPCVEVAKNKLSKLVGADLELLGEDAKTSLDRNLLLRLSSICGRTLFEEFSQFRSSGDSVRDFLLLRIGGKNRDEKYRAFIDKLFEDNLLSLFKEYSVLGRLVAIAIDFWVEASAEFIERLAKDWSEIKRRFSPKIPLKQVANLKLGLSDPHNRGRSVIGVKFDTELKLIYKPKSLSPDLYFYQFQDWCNQHGAPLQFKFPQILNYSTYGWMEYVESGPCADKQEARNFYQRSGMLLCLIHVVRGTDCHLENLIASGEHPVIIDLETILSHQTKTLEKRGSDAFATVSRQLEESVTRTLMLPQWDQQGNNGFAMDLSGLGGVEEQELSVMKLNNINTDAMDVDCETVTVQLQDNAPILNGTSLSPQDYLEELVGGFEQMYRFLLLHQSTLLEADSPLMNLADREVRYLFRATRIYATILQQSYQPSLLRSGIDRSIGLDVLSRAFLTTEEKPLFWEILAAELEALEQSDIPFFTADSSQNFLPLAKGVVIEELFEQPSFDWMLLGIKNLTEADLAQQIEIIRGSFYSRFVKEPNSLTSDNTLLPQTTASLTSEQLVESAIKIAEDLQQRAIFAADGSVSWVGLGYAAKSQSFQLQGLGSSLYDGSSGLALFLAALAKVTDNSKWGDLALATLQTLRQSLDGPNSDTVARLRRALGISGATGLGSIAYGFAQIGQFLQNSELLQDARKVASWITPDSIAADKTFDIIEGTAGTLLSLLALHRLETSNPSNNALELAIACGEHLLEHQTSAQELPQAWKTGNGKQLAGFSQGAAGIAYALLQLFAVTQNPRFFDGAVAAIEYEQSLFCEEEKNWPDLRSEEPVFRVSWANGAPGIGLGRLGALPVLDTPEIRHQIAVAIETTQRFCLDNADNLCWGNSGRLETLLVASEKLDRPDLEEFVGRAVTHTLNLSRSRGTFMVFPDLPPKVYNPGFFQGVTGIGYQLLRIAYPKLLPSVLLWE
ncbi:MAG: type 2 lanthipeptide synthetase LanM family protein [Prochloraceae cyanobacterium]|nr:type 2 lanthipeptide synthetase LanM family protein [Prochloraceae cyanobacterium]